MRLRSLLTLVVFAVSFAGTADAASFLDHDIRFDAGRAAVRAGADGDLLVAFRGGSHEFAAGQPDLPWVTESVTLPAGQRVARVEVLALRTEPFGPTGRVAPAIVPQPGSGPIVRTSPDAAAYASSAFLPESPAQVGLQGWQRGTHVAALRIAPVRWQPSTGRLERVVEMRLRLVLEDAADGDVVRRERIVPEWEDAGAIASARSMGARVTPLTAASRTAQPFKATQIPSILGSPVAYVIITSDALAPQFQALADWKTQKGLPAVVRTTSFIDAQYPQGADGAERVRMFIKDAYSRWGTKWVLLAGDTDVIPERLSHTTFYGGEDIACDMYFQCLDGNWNADGDSTYGEGFASSANPGDAVDLLPEVWVGRAPVVSTTDAQTFINKTLQYEKTPLGNYENAILGFAEVLFPQDWHLGDFISLDGAELIEELLPYTDTDPDVTVARLYENYTDSRWRPGALQLTRQTVVDSLSRGYNMAIHVGHGYRNVMSVGDDNMSTSDAMSLTNGNKLINLYAIDCTSNAIDFPCIGEAFMLNPNGGAVTNVGSTRFDFPTAGRAYQTEYFRLMFQDSVTAVGELISKQKLPFVSFASFDGVQRWTQMTLLLLGDPELRIYRGRPRNLVVSHNPTFALSDSQFTVTVTRNGQPIVGATVTLYKSGDEYRSVATNGSGVALLPFRPDSLGSAKLTVTALDSRPYQADVPVVSASAPVLGDAAPLIDDDSVGGTIGNGDALVDAGELIDLRIAVRNNGGSSASTVTGTLTTTDPLVSVVNPSVSYGTIGAGASANPATGFRVNFPYTLPDQREVPFTLLLTDNAGRTFRENVALTVRAPEIAHFSHLESESPGNGNGRPEPGEAVTYQIQLRNLGTGAAELVSAKLRNVDGLATVVDSSASFGTIAPGATVTGDAVLFLPSSASAKFNLVVSDRYGELFTQPLDLQYPAAPVSLVGTGAASSIALKWGHGAEPDLYGYNLFRSSNAAGPFTKVNPVPIGRTSYFLDSNLAPLTRYYYRVSAVDSSGNESSQSAVANVSTNPPTHTVFPIPTTGNSPSSPALEHIYGGSTMDIVASSDLLYVFHADGTAPVDADGSGATSGDFSQRGRYFPAAPAVGKLDGTNWSIVGASWDSTRVYVFDPAGQVRPGWPLVLPDGLWSTPALGDLDGDGHLELAFGSNGNKFYVMRDNGTEWLDGDSNPATKGVFKLTGQTFNYCSPAIADIDGNGQSDIVWGGFDGVLNVWRPNGTNVGGFPVALSGNITSSPAVGFLDGPGDTTPEIVIACSNESLYVFEPDGKRRAGWPVWTRTSGSSRQPSPALADMNNDGFLDVVWTSTNGGVYCFDRTGQVMFGLSNLRYSTLTTGATQGSPVVADINGDGSNDIVIGDEFGLVSAFSGLGGGMLPGFPIQLGAEARGSAALADIDQDGLTEIVLTGWDGKLYVWDYDFPFSPNGPAPWPQFRHDARRTGYFNAPLFVGVDDPATPPAGAIKALRFAAVQPNPARSATRFALEVPADRAGRHYELAIHDLAGRRVRQLDHGTARSGRIDLGWDLRGDDGAPVVGGVYFARFTLGGETVSRKLVVMP